MDVTPEYVKMCEKAEEIQKCWKPTGGDWYLFDYRGTTKTSREFENQIWGDDDKTWKRVEIMCYQPSEVKDLFVSTDGKTSHVMSAADMVRRAVWIPRQDQLQRMVLDTDAITTEFKFHGWIITSNYIPIGLPQPSMEQLWLAFVMSEKYDKIWDGTGWVCGQ